MPGSEIDIISMTNYTKNVLDLYDILLYSAPQQLQK